MKAKTLLLPLLFLVLAAPAHAQRWGWGGGWGGDNKAATVGESHARGMSDIIRSRGKAELDSSQASINRTEARSRELDNHNKAANTYFSMRNMNREQRFGTPEQKYEHKVANEQKYFRHAQQGSPDQLTAQQLDPITGKINWPFSLMPENFAEYRETLDKLFEKRAQQGGYTSYEVYSSVRQATGDMTAALNKEIRKMEPKDYLEAKQFIGALEFQVETKT